MKLTELLASELEREAALSRRVLERVPEGKNDWKPHPKSMRLGYLAVLVASMPGWIDLMINQEELNFDSPGRNRPEEVRSNAALLSVLDSNLTKARAALSARFRLGFRTRLFRFDPNVAFETRGARLSHGGIMGSKA